MPLRSPSARLVGNRDNARLPARTGGDRAGRLEGCAAVAELEVRRADEPGSSLAGPDVMEVWMHGTAGRDDAPSPLALEEEAASRSPARLLISASTPHGVEALARRIHGGGPRGQLPFVQTRAAELPVEPAALREYCMRVLDAAAGGSVLVAAVEEMPAAVQDVIIEVLAEPEAPSRRPAAVRLISGTTVSLLDRIAAGTFSERLFYRLNTFHLVAGDPAPGAATA